MDSLRKKIYFASDAHLGARFHKDPLAIEKRLVRWLDSIKNEAMAIYFLGDMFDYWYEYKYVVPKGFVRFLGKLAELSDNGVEIHIFIGNHDIWMFDYLTKEIGAVIHRDVLTIDLLGKRFFLGHGDEVDYRSRAFRFLRTLFRNRFCQWLYAGIHPRWTFGFALGWSLSSRKSGLKKHKTREAAEYQGEDHEYMVLFAKEYLKTHPDIINSGTNIPTDAVAIATDLIAVGTAAEADCVTTESKDIVASGADAEGYYAIAIVDSLIDGKQAYLSVDTNYVAEKEQYFMFKADTLTSTGTDNEVVAAFGKCINLFAYQLTVNPELIAGDEVTINTFMPTATTQGQWYSEGITPTKAVVVIRSLANNSHREVSVAANTSDPSYENTTITFKSLEGPKPTFEVGDVFFIKSLKKEDARKPYQVMTSTTGDDIVGATAVYNNVPATQWIVTEANKQDGKYQLANRDADKNFFASATKIIVKDAENNIYITAGKDTLEMTAVADQKDAYLGYKHINDADKEHLTFKLTATNFVNPEAKYYLTMAADSSVIATADADKALELKAKNAGWLFKLNDTDLSAASYGFELYLGEDTLYFRNDAASFDGNDLMLTKVATKDSVKLRR